MVDLTTSKMANGTTVRASETTESTLTGTTTNNPTIEVETELYPWATSNEERRRSFIFEYFNWNADIHVDAQIQQLDRINKWLLGR